jgi:hypothetical protein
MTRGNSISVSSSPDGRFQGHAPGRIEINSFINVEFEKWRGDVVESFYFRIFNLSKFDNRYL